MFLRICRIHEVPMFDAVVGDSEFHPFGAHRLCEFADDITLRAHLLRVPASEFAVVHGEAVMMLGCRYDVCCPGFLEQFRPLLRIEFLSLEQWDEFLVPEIFRVAPMVDVMLQHSAIHVARIPFAPCCRYAVHSPMDEDSELAVDEPLRCLVILFDRLPRVGVRTGRDVCRLSSRQSDGLSCRRVGVFLHRSGTDDSRQCKRCKQKSEFFHVCFCI